METLPEHTFVITAYKESQYLEECIQSVIKQTISNQILITTSTPNPHISTLAEKYRIEVKINTNSGSIGKDWNFGYNSASTKFVTLAHQDDIYHSSFAEKCIAAAKKNPSSKPLIVFTNSVVYKGGKELNVSYKNILRWLFIFPFHFKNCISSKWWKKFILLFSNGISCPGVFYVKENLENFQFHEEEKYILDWRAWYEMSKMKGSFVYANNAFHTHREHKESATSTTHLDVLQEEELKLLTEIWGNKLFPKIITAMLRLTK